MHADEPDKRLKMIEIVLTLGGFLGVIVSLLQDQLVPQARTTFTVVIVLFIIFAFFAYSSLAIPLPERATKFFLGGLSALFSGLIVLPLSIPFTTATSGVFTFSLPYLGVTGALLLYFAVAFALTILIYLAMTRAIMLSFDRLAPRRA